jgi:capsular polysaccharide export protein
VTAEDAETPAFPWTAAAKSLDASPPASPFTGAPLSDAAAAVIRADWREILSANRRIAVAAGMAKWKREAIGRFLWAPRETPLAMVDAAAAAVDEATRLSGGIAVWPSRAPDGLATQAAAAAVPLFRVEDGFIRSVGLGAGLHPPLSIVVDGRGIYYDPRQSSDLEHLLQHHPFPPGLLARAECLAATVVAQGISKYGRTVPPPPSPRPAGRLVLVAGQVEDDASVAAGGAGVAGNLDLLIRARAAEPDATLLFKPHPDVDAGHRRGRVPDATLLAHADRIVRDEPMPALLARVDAVHVLTSLTGFEALLRGREVVCHGQPFFAGWGLTRDLGPSIPRRTRRLTLAQLVVGTLILYPRYLDPVSGLPCPPEVLLMRFAAGWRPRATWLTRARAWQGRIARLLGTTTD